MTVIVRCYLCQQLFPTTATVAEARHGVIEAPLHAKLPEAGIGPGEWYCGAPGYPSPIIAYQL